MLAPLDTPPNPNTPGSSSDALLHSQSISSRAPQEAYYQLDDNSRASALVAASPQHVDGNAVPPTYTADSSPYRTPSTVRSPHSQSTEYSPSASHPQAYSPALSSNYIPPPSPTPSQLHANPVPGGQQYQHQYQQNMYQDPYQQTYQQTYQQHQPYPEPTLHAYPEPELVDAIDEKYRPSSAGSMTKPTNGRRKKIIWVGVIVTLILIAAIIGIMVSKNNENSDNKGGNSIGNSGSRNSTTGTTATPTSTSTSFSRSSVSLIPVTVPGPSTTVSLIPVTVPTPAPTSGGGNGGGGNGGGGNGGGGSGGGGSGGGGSGGGGSGGGGNGSGGSGGSGSVTPTPPVLPPKQQCSTFFCEDWVIDCRTNQCGKDSAHQACTDKCKGEFMCESECQSQTSCQKQCDVFWSDCRNHCDPPH